MSIWIQLATAIIAVALISFTSYQWGYKTHALEQSEQINKSLAESAKFIIDEQAKQQKIEDIIVKSDDKTVIKSPVLMRTLKRVSDCSGKTQC